MVNRSVRRVLVALGRLYPWPVDASHTLARSLAFLDANVRAETVIRAGYGGALVSALVVAPVALALGFPLPVVALLALGTALSVTHIVHAAPRVLARLRRTAALGAAPDLVARAVLRMRVTPTLEGAAAFAARTGRGPLAASLDEHVGRAAGTGDSGLGGFATEWATWFPALRRAILLVEAAADTPAHDRSHALDRALEAILDGTHTRMQSFANEVRGPATALYAFGVLLPLALVSVLPAAGVAGLPVSLPLTVLVYDVILPVGLFLAGVWLLARRPVAFRPATVPPSHPSIPDHRWRSLLAGLLAGLIAWVALPIVVGVWARPVGALGFGVGVALAAFFHPEKRVRDRTREIETGLPDALYLIGRRVTDGASVETAIADAGDELTGAIGTVLTDAARRQRQLRVGVEEAFVGDVGPLASVASPRAHGSVSLLELAAIEGAPAGAAAVALADHLEDLQDVERDARAALVRVTETLQSTAAIFAPLVGGVTVALGDAMGTVGGAGTSLPTGGLGTAVGLYVCLLAVLLTGISVGLDRGLDRALVGYRIGVALVSATAVYLAAFLAAGAFV